MARIIRRATGFLGDSDGRRLQTQREEKNRRSKKRPRVRPRIQEAETCCWLCCSPSLPKMIGTTAIERIDAVRSETVRPQRRFPPHEMRLAASNKHGGGNPIEGRGGGCRFGVCLVDSRERKCQKKGGRGRTRRIRRRA